MLIDYYLLLKPRIIVGNLVTFMAGFALAGGGFAEWRLFATAFIGLALVIASACICNNAIDRDLDRRMRRTRKRPLVTGAIEQKQALLFATFLWACGTLTLLQANALTALLANSGFVIYVLLYTTLKRRTPYSTLIGSLAGSIPPTVGYCAMSGAFDSGALLLFLVLFFWQMPHFYAIGLWHQADYARAGIPILPVARGPVTTKVRMLLYIAILLPILSALSFYGYTGKWFLLGAVGVGVLWLALGVNGLRRSDHARWGHQMFRLSLVLIQVISVLILFDHA